MTDETTNNDHAAIIELARRLQTERDAIIENEYERNDVDYEAYWDVSQRIRDGNWIEALVALADENAALKARLATAIAEAQREVDACAHVTDDWAEYTGNSDDQVNWAFAVSARSLLKILTEIMNP